MKLYILILVYSFFSLYLPACEKCAEDMEKTILDFQYRIEHMDDNWKVFFLGAIQGIKITQEIYYNNHDNQQTK